MKPRPHFLQPLGKSGVVPQVLVNTRTGLILATDLELAADSRTRTKGLLGRASLAQDTVMILAPCNGIHTFFMRFAIDVVFTDRQVRVLKVVRGLKPWRIGFSLRAFSALEFAAGGHDDTVVAKGDQLVFADK